MMALALPMLTGALKSWKLIGVGLLALLLAVQTGRLSHVTKQRNEARAAQIDPATKRSWKIEAQERGRDLGTCLANTGTLTAALDRQSAAVAAAGAEGQARTAEAEKAVQAARTATQRAEAKARAILSAPMTGGDTCSRVLAVDDQFVKELQ